MSEEATLDEFSKEGADAEAEPTPDDTPQSRFWGIIPDDWELVSGSKVYDVNPNPKSDEEPNTYIEMDALDTELPFPKYFGERNASEYSGKTFTAGDTLFARITPCTENGKAALVPKMDTQVGIGSTEYAVLSPDTSRILPWYLYYLIKSHPVHNYAVSRMRGSTGRQRVPFSVFRQELDIALPPPEEQRKIASVLYTIDHLLQKTSEYVNRLSELKHSALGDLLSSGYFSHQKWQTVDYQDASLMARSNKLPKEWDILEAKNICDIKTGHTPSRSNDEYWGGNIPWLDVEDIRNVDGRVIRSTDEKITRKGLENSGAKLLPKGTLISCRMRAIGVSAILGEEMATNQDYVSFECDETQVLPEYLLYLFEFAKPQLSRLTVGSTHPKIQLSFFPSLRIPLPNIQEQKEIVNVISSIEDTILENQRYARHVRKLKGGLIQDLLSGDVRTGDAAIDIPDEIIQYG